MFAHLSRALETNDLSPFDRRETLRLPGFSLQLRHTRDACEMAVRDECVFLRFICEHFALPPIAAASLCIFSVFRNSQLKCAAVNWCEQLMNRNLQHFGRKHTRVHSNRRPQTALPTSTCLRPHIMLIHFFLFFQVEFFSFLYSRVK